MSLLKFKSEIDLTDPQQTELLQNFIAALGVAKRNFLAAGKSYGAYEDAPLVAAQSPTPPEMTPEEPPKPRRRRRTKAQIEADKAEKLAAQKAEQPEQEQAAAACTGESEEAPINEEQAEEVTLATVRKQAKPLLATHRNEIISKFAEMGVTSVAKIKAGDLPAFSAFLKGLASE